MNKFEFVLIFVFISFLLESCFTEIEYEKYIITDLNQNLSDTLKVKTVERINNLEVWIIGNINGESFIEFENGAGRYNKIVLKGNVNYFYETEWYDSKCNFIYTPTTQIHGDSLYLKYRIY